MKSATAHSFNVQKGETVLQQSSDAKFMTFRTDQNLMFSPPNTVKHGKSIS